jgi:hypothetical protein
MYNHALKSTDLNLSKKALRHFDILPARKRDSLGVRLPIHGGNLRVRAHFFGTFVRVYGFPD